MGADCAEKSGFPRLYVIVDRATLDARSLRVGAFARELREAGVRLLQYRDKVGSPQDVLRAAAEISAALAGTDAMLVMNDRADLAVLAGWSGVHVGHKDMPLEAVRRVLAAEMVPEVPHSSREKMRDEWATRGIVPVGCGFVGVSTHNEEQVLAADGSVETGSESLDPGHPVSAGGFMTRGADYIAIGPVFATVSKADTEPVVGLEGVRRARALTMKPLVAIGGITRANARSVIEAGADAVAVIGGLFGEGESVAGVARDFLRILG